ncbi:hypothetical protein KC19_VG101000 [Ceratodon purpureus]|uniref:Uncharacterized protein n=1 Tax=Ceratodon purpureus TaxID=3225 RepID=A0A8T0HNZ4_CERPU|nr:hypothetical protein KC19_VG101000 [Ceratodon purpureus]
MQPNASSVAHRGLDVPSLVVPSAGRGPLRFRVSDGDFRVISPATRPVDDEMMVSALLEKSSPSSAKSLLVRYARQMTSRVSNKYLSSWSPQCHDSVKTISICLK